MEKNYKTGRNLNLNGIVTLSSSYHIFKSFVLSIAIYIAGISSLMGQIAPVGTSTTSTSASATSIIINKPTGVVEGNIMIATFAEYGTANTTAYNPACAGWTLINANTLGGQTNRRGIVLYKIATATEPASYTFTQTTLASYIVGQITAFSGVNTTTPFDVAPGVLTVGGVTATSAFSVAGVTTVTANAAVVVVGMESYWGRTWSGWTATNPTLWTEQIDAQYAGWASVGLAWKIRPTAGATGNATATLSATSHWAGMVLALRPAAAPTITSISPLSGCPGTSVTITGTNLLGATVANVKVGGTAVTSITSNSGTSLVAVVGTGTTGTISVTTSATATSGSTFTFLSAPAAPTANAASTVTSTSASVSWSASAGATQYFLDVSTSSTFATFVTGYNNLNVGNVTSYSITGLSVNTTYYYRVRASNGSCAGGNSGTISFYTGYCIPTNTTTGDYISSFSTTGGSTNVSTSGTSTAALEDYTAQVVTSYATGIINFSGAYVGGFAGFSIWVDWNNNLVFDASELMYNAAATAASWTGSFIVPAGQAVGNYRMRIRAQWNTLSPPACGAVGYGQAEDYTFTVTTPPSCVAPTALVSSNITSTTATISWTAASPAPASGYQYYVSTSATAPTAGTTPTGSTAAGVLTANITGLTANTTYYFWVRSNCGGTQSTWTGSSTFFTGYCQASGNSTYIISSVVTSGGATNISNATGSNAGYGNYTAQSASNSVGTPTSITVQHSATVGGAGLGIWIDWNNDLDFADANEQIAITTGWNYSPFTATINIPAGQAVGSYRMRIVCDYNAIAPSYCPSAISGETEDYTFQVVTPPSCVSPSGLTSSSVTTSSATISWTAASPAPTNGYQYYVSTSSTAPTAGTTPTGTTAAGVTTANLTGLTSNVTYYFWVRSDCGGSGTSTWAGSSTFYTGNPACTNTSSFPSTPVAAPTTNATSTISTCNFQSEYSTVSGITSGSTYIFNYLDINNISSGYITIRTGTYNGTVVAAGNAPLTWVANMSGTVYVHYTVDNTCATLSNCGTSTIQCSSCGGPTPPANDLVCNATTITCGQNLAGTTINATLTGTYETGTCGTSISQPGVWYVVAGTGDVMTASLCATAWDSKMSVFSGTSCTALTCLGGVDDNGPACTGTSASYSWTSSVGTNYYILVHGFSAASAFNISLTCTPPPPANPTSITASAAYICEGSGNSVTLTAVGAVGTVYWFAGSCGTTGQIGTGNSITVSPAATTYYYARNFSSSQFSAGCANIEIEVRTPPSVIAGANTAICNGSSVQLGATVNSSSVLPTLTGGTNGCTGGNMFNITTDPYPVTITSFDITPDITGTQTVNVYYRNGTYVGSETTAASWTLLGSYSVTGTADVLVNLPITPLVIPASSTYGIYLNYNAAYTNGDNAFFDENITVSAGVGLCSQFGGVNLSRTFNGKIYYDVNPTLSWSPSASLSSSTIANPIASPTTTTVYTLTGTFQSCSSSSNVTVTVNSNPTSAPSFAANPICNGASTTLSANATAGSGTISTYAWSSGISGNNASGSVSTAGTYTVTVTNSNGCTVTATSPSLTLNALPTAAPSFAANPICSGTNTTLSANATAGSGTISTYAWSSGITGNNASGSVSTAGAYTVTVTNSNGCTVSGTSAALALNAIPTASPSLAANPICSGASTTLSANATAGSGTISTYAWSSGISGNNASGSVSNAGTYTVTVTNSNGCTTTATSSALALNANPTAAPTFVSNSICNGTSTTLNANATAGSGTISTYAWSSGISGNNASGSVSTAGTYTVTVTNSNGCTSTASSSALTVNALPSAVPSFTSNPICSGSNVTLNANATAGSGTLSTYSWSSGITGNNASGNVSTAGTYTVTVTNSNGCTATASSSALSLNSLPSVSASASSTTVCEGSNVTLSGSGATSYSWSGGITNGQAFAASASTTSYNVTGTDANGCTATGSVNLVVNTVSTVPTVTSVPGRLCPNTSSSVSAGGGIAGTGSIINWYSGPNGTGTLLGTGSSISLPFAASTTVYVRREGACNNTADVSTTINIRAFMTISANSATTSNYCVDDFGWGHWYDSNDEIIFSAKGDFSMCPPGFPQVVVSRNNANSFYQMSQNSTSLCASNMSPGEMRFEMGRSWNLDMGGATPSGLYSVRFYFLTTERSAVIAAAADTMANSAYASCGYSPKYNAANNGWFWFKNQGTAYVAPQWQGVLYDGALGTTSNSVTYVEMDSIPSFSGGSGGVILVPNSTLPISWKSFTGETDNKVNYLKWITATEENTELFEVQRSADGINFETIGLVAAAGSSTSDKMYNFDDNHPIVGINYYRLRMVELDGTSDYSNVIALEVKGDKKPYVFYPNPVTEVLTYQFTSEMGGDVSIEVMDALGRVLKSENRNSVAGSNQLFFDMSNLIQGTYSIRVRHLQTAEMHTDIIIKK